MCKSSLFVALLKLKRQLQKTVPVIRAQHAHKQGKYELLQVSPALSSFYSFGCQRQKDEKAAPAPDNVVAAAKETRFSLGTNIPLHSLLN